MILALSLSAGLLALAFAGWQARRLYASEAGTPELQAAAAVFRKEVIAMQGRQLAALGAASAGAAALVYAALALFGSRGHIAAVQAAVSFLCGSFAAALAGFMTGQASLLGSVKAAAGARTSVLRALAAALAGGAAGAIASFSVCLAGMGALFFLLGGLTEGRAVPLKMAGFCLGAAFSAMFFQLSGGIYAASAGGESRGSGKSDDPAGAAAGLAGSNDAGWRQGADLFCSASVQTAAAMILGAGLWQIYGAGGVLFPLAARACGLAASVAGVLTAKGPEGAKPMSVMNRGYAWTSGVSIAGLGLAVYFLLGGNMWLFMAGFIGIASGGLLVFTSYYYSAPKYRPSRRIAEFSKAGPASAALGGISAAMESAAAPVLIIAAALLGAYYCGIRGLEAYMTLGLVSAMNCGFYGASVAAAGLLSAEAYMTAAGSLYPIAVNSAALADLTRQSPETRKNAEALRELGETARPLAGGYSLGAAALAVILLFAAYMDSVKVLSGLTFESVNIARVEVFIGGFIGAALVCVFGALAIRALLKASAGAGAGPKLAADAAAARALRYAAVPGLLAAAAPVAVGLVFRLFGLGAEALAAFLLVGAVCGMLGGAVIDNCAGAWDSAGKAMELEDAGEGKAARKAVLACAAAGDTLKDSSFAPALYALIKLAAASALVLAPLFI